MAYMRNVRPRGMRGVYGEVNFPLPSNSLPAAAAAVKAAANLVVASGRVTSPGMAGAYGPPARQWPGAYSRRAMPVLPAQASSRARAALSGQFGLGQSSVSGITDWLKNNPGTAIAVGLAAVLLLGVAKGRRR